MTSDHRIGDDNENVVVGKEDHGSTTLPSKPTKNPLRIRLKRIPSTVQNEGPIHDTTFGNDFVGNTSAHGSPEEGEAIENEKTEDHQNVEEIVRFPDFVGNTSSHGSSDEGEAIENENAEDHQNVEEIVRFPDFVGNTSAHGSPEEGEAIENENTEDHQNVEEIVRFPMGGVEENTADHDAFSESSKSFEDQQVGDLTSKKPIEALQMDENICKVCGKPFASVKAVHGHMRKHPERAWRGMTQPVGDGSQDDLSLSDGQQSTNTPSADSSFDQGLCVSDSWPARARRGRQGTKYLYHQTDPTSPEAIAAKCLLLLKYGPSCNQKSDQFSGTEKQIELNDLGVEKNENGLRDLAHASTRFRRNIDRSEVGDCDFHEPEADVNEHRETLSDPLAFDVKTKKEMEHLEGAYDTSLTTHRREYRCITCNKCFSSHQALGGHRASHNKCKNLTEKAEVSEKTKEANLDADETAAARHRCKTCNLTFPTGQALGGHMRRHWTGSENRAVDPPATSLESPEAKRPEIDLNMPPESEDGGDS